MGPVTFQVLNTTFIAPGQMWLNWLITFPMHQVWLWLNTPLTALDGVATVLFLALLTGETIADQQMWNLQQKKQNFARGKQVIEPF